MTRYTKKQMAKWDDDKVKSLFVVHVSRMKEKHTIGDEFNYYGLWDEIERRNWLITWTPSFYRGSKKSKE
jgi:hypothetical protein